MTTAEINTWSCGPLDAELRRMLDRLREVRGVERIAVMPDAHPAEGVAVGVVVATRGVVIPRAVGGDIGCGMAAIRFDGPAAAIASESVAARLFEGLAREVPTNRHPRRTMPDALPPHLAERPLSDAVLESMKERDARVQLGTLGRGNHFLEFQADDDGVLWLMVHTGSRAVGPAVTRLAWSRATKRSKSLELLDVDSDAGHAYLDDLEWALAYADENRRRIVDAVVRLVDAELGFRPIPESYFSCRHNFVRLEDHDGETPWWVHRKGAMSAREGERGVIPGSMGTSSFHVEGRGHRSALSSSSHGAGRAMARGVAMKTISSRRLLDEMRGVYFDHRLVNRLRDEAPGAYKDIGKVMRAQRDLVRIVRRLRPILSYKGA